MSGELHLQLARMLQAAGRIDEAEKMFRRAIYLRPGYWPANHWFARMLQSQARYDDAAIEYRRIVELAHAQLEKTPDDSEILVHIASMYATVGDRENALTALDAVIQNQPESPLILAYIAETFEDLGLRDQAQGRGKDDDHERNLGLGSSVEGRTRNIRSGPIWDGDNI